MEAGISAGLAVAVLFGIYWVAGAADQVRGVSRLDASVQSGLPSDAAVETRNDGSGRRRSAAQAAQPSGLAAGRPIVEPPIAFALPPAGPPSSGPEVSARSAILVDVGRGTVLYAKEPRRRLPMASTAKIMTAIVALEHAELNRQVSVTPAATATEPNLMGLTAGETLPLLALLYGLMLDSGNDAAEAIARGLYARGQFLQLMNDHVAVLGLRDTYFANPSGMDDPDQYSTAYDLAVIGAYALRNPTLRQIVGAKRYVVESVKGEHGWYGPTNLNGLLSTYQGAIGIKPGWTAAAGYTLVGAAERHGVTLLAVVLDSKRHFSDAAALLDFGFARSNGQ